MTRERAWRIFFAPSLLSFAPTVMGSRTCFAFYVSSSGEAPKALLVAASSPLEFSNMVLLLVQPSNLLRNRRARNPQTPPFSFHSVAPPPPAAEPSDPAARPRPRLPEPGSEGDPGDDRQKRQAPHRRGARRAPGRHGRQNSSKGRLGSVRFICVFCSPPARLPACLPGSCRWLQLLLCFFSVCRGMTKS